LTAVVRTLINAEKEQFNNRQEEEYSNEENLSIQVKTKLTELYDVT
jgi:hypothetical protein